MAVKLNLLPASYSLTGPMAQLVKLLRPLNVILLVGFLIMILGMGGFFIFSSISLQNLATSNQTLTSKIQAQEVGQQQIALLKDRLKQIATIQSQPTALKNLTNVSPLLAQVAGNSTISELAVDPQKTSASLVFKSNTDLTNFMKTLSTTKAFNSSTLSSFSYNPGSGFLVTLDFK